MNSEIIISALFGLGGLFGIGWCLVMISRSIDSEDWDRVDCEIMESRVKTIGGESVEYVPVIKYKYSVHGIPFEGDIVKYGGQSGWKSTADDICRKYYKGKIAKLSVDPNDPNHSVLLPGISSRVYRLLIISVAFLAMGLITVLRFYNIL